MAAPSNGADDSWKAGVIVLAAASFVMGVSLLVLATRMRSLTGSFCGTSKEASDTYATM